MKQKKTIENSGVPVIPGYHEADADTKILIKKGKEIGFPLLIKAVMGEGERVCGL